MRVRGIVGLVYAIIHLIPIISILTGGYLIYAQVAKKINGNKMIEEVGAYDEKWRERETEELNRVIKSGYQMAAAFIIVGIAMIAFGWDITLQ